MRARFHALVMPLFLGLLVLFSASLCSEEFAFDPPKNFTLNPKYVALHHPVQTANIQAQLYFDQGLTFIYAFNHEAAYWSFLRASESDPKMAMAYWGMALALGMNINTPISPERSKIAYASITKANQLAIGGPDHELAYVQALAKRYSDNPNADQNKLGADYSSAMEQLSGKYPDDLDAAVLYAESLLDLNPWHQWSLEGKPLTGTMKAVRKLESVLKRDPDHLGANHYFIHAVEASSHPEIALMSAERLRTLLPSSGHILHMSSHIFMLVGNYRQAAASNEAAIAADRAFIREYGIRGNYPVHYMTHNYYVLVRAYTMEGRFEDAKGAAENLVEFYVPHFMQMPELEYYATAPMSVLIAFQRWDDLLELPKPSEQMRVNSVLWRFGRALAFAKLGDLKKAHAEQSLFLDGKSKLTKDEVFGYNPAQKILVIADLCLKAELEAAQGNAAQALDSLKKAVKEQDALQYNEPPDWFFPIRETLGAFLLKKQKPEEAEAVFRQELQRHPRNGRALFGLMESLKAQSKTYDYSWVNEEFQKAWKYSDISLTTKK